MKKSFFFRILLAVPLVLVACEKSDDIKLDFTIEFPDDWTQYIYGEEGRVLDAARLAKSGSDTLRESLVVFRNHFPASNLGVYYATLQQEIIKSPAYDSALYVSDTVMNSYNFKKLRSHERLLYIDSFTRDTLAIGAVTERYFVYHNEYGYNFTFVTPDTAFARLRETFDNIMGTFRFKN